MSKKIKILIPIVAILIVAIVVTVVVIVNLNKDSYRTIQVYEIEGTACVERESIGSISVYNNMMLESGDKITVDSNSHLLLKLDGDKYVLVEENSELEMIAEGTQKHSQTKIQLQKGAIFNRIDKKLSSKSSYEVNTSNSTMAIRATVFGVRVSEDGQTASLSVYDGRVEAAFLDEEGKPLESKNVMVEEGKQIDLQFGQKPDDSSFGQLDDLKCDDLTLNELKFLDDIWKDNRNLSVPEQEIESRIEDMQKPVEYQIDFVVGDVIFASQTVEKGQKVTKPTLQPKPTGHWDFDFEVEPTSSLQIQWVD